MRIPIGTQLAPRRDLDLPPFLVIPEPALPFPSASGSVLQPVPQTFPGSSLTYESFLYSQLQNSVQPGTANTFTAPQDFEAPLVISGTDTATNTALRLETFEHKTSGVVAAGFGIEHGWQSRDGSGNLAPIGRMQIDVTNPTTGSVQSAWAFGTNNGGAIVEILRLRPGMSTTVDASSFSGFTGGELWCRGNFRMSGAAFSVFNAIPVGQQTGGAASAGGTYTSAEQGMINRMYSALQAYGFIT